MKFNIADMKSGGLIVLLFIFTAVGFFMPISGTSWLSGIIKGLLFFFVTLILLLEYLQKDKPVRDKIETDFAEEHSSHIKEMLSDEPFEGYSSLSPTEGFKWYYREYLDLLKTMLVASSAALYLKKRTGLILLGGIGDNAKIQRQIVVPEGELVELIAKQQKPLLEGNLPIGMQLTGFEGADIRSFLGIPLMWADKLVGVLAFGTQVTGSFSEDDKQLAIRSGRLLTQVMALFHLGVQWESSDSIARIHLQLEKKLRMIDDMNQAATFFAEAIKPLFPYDRFTLCKRDGDEGIVKTVIGQIDDIDRGYQFSLNDGINGWVMKRRSPLMLADMKSGDFKRPRYSKAENPKHGMRSFLGIPIGHGEQAWGSICLEHSYANKYEEKNKEMLYTLSFALEATLERLSGIRKKTGSHANDTELDQFTLEI